MPAVSGMIRAMSAVPRVFLASPEKNAQEITSLLRKADQECADLCVFPELALCGYSCGDLIPQPALLDGCLRALKTLLNLDVRCTFIVGLPLDLDGRLYNCAAVISRGRLLGIVPKLHLPNSGEFYERRWFEPGRTAPESTHLFGQDVPVGSGLCFNCGRFSFGVEICEDLWVPIPPSSSLCASGALLIANLSASNELVGKHKTRCELIAQQSSRCLCGYLYSSAGYGESTTDLVFSGYAGIYENGSMLSENERFQRTSSYAIADIDVQCLEYKRRLRHSFSDETVVPLHHVFFDFPVIPHDDRLLRPMRSLPFVPDGSGRDEEDILTIQATALITRMECVGTKRAVLGVSGGLDSTLTLLAAAYAFRRAGYDMTGLTGITMPGLGTGSRTLQNALKLMELIGCTSKTISIGAAVAQHFEDIGQNPDIHDVCYENSQARERTQIIMDFANKFNALALGTGDLSELALGWCTYNGDQMSMYNVNASIPKTLIRPLLRYAASLFGDEVVSVVEDIMDTPISPELIPSREGELTQRTEDTLGAYALHDFFLYHMMESGSSPIRLYELALRAFDGQYAPREILSTLRTFVRRFFTQQFKRSAMPDGPKIVAVSLSPRGDWRMPSDAQMELWMNEVNYLEKHIF